MYIIMQSILRKIKNNIFLKSWREIKSCNRRVVEPSRVAFCVACIFCVGCIHNSPSLLSIYLSINLSIHPSIHQSIPPSIYGWRDDGSAVDKPLLYSIGLVLAPQGMCQADVYYIIRLLLYQVVGSYCAQRRPIDRGLSCLSSRQPDVNMQLKPKHQRRAPMG